MSIPGELQLKAFQRTIDAIPELAQMPLNFLHNTGQLHRHLHIRIRNRIVSVYDGPEWDRTRKIERHYLNAKEWNENLKDPQSIVVI